MSVRRSFFHHVAYYYQRLFAEQLFDKINVFGDVCHPKMLAIIQYDTPAFGIVFAKFPRQNFHCLAIKRIVMS